MARFLNDQELSRDAPLIDRQRRLWAHAEAIQRAQEKGVPLPEAISEWLHRALKNIACGTDANAAFNVIPEKRGVRKDGFLAELRQKAKTGYIAAATEEGPDKKTVKQALDEVSVAFPTANKSTVRKNYNKLSTERKPTFTIGKK